ncbi:MAG: protein kinase, partial [Anaerolineae bacterium]|nr:protein kinase [Anaerolineae bacterium]
GGFATVYLAQPRHQQETEDVALKVLNSRENYGRFLREVETVAKLNHPNIIRILDTGEDESTGAPFFSMEYIPSGTLCDRLDTEYRLSRNEALEIVRQIGGALTYPHQQGIIHRDVNPKNILLDTRYKPARPVLTDFGMVKPVTPDDSKLTETIALIGTFAYYAPEQWKKEEVGPATDVYALAITFFEMLSGQRPFRGDLFSLREKHLREPLPPLSSAAPEVGSFFDHVLIKATAKISGDRYQTVGSFIRALETANDKADVAERMARRKRAIEALEVAQGRVRRGDYITTEVLEVIDLALEEYPGYGDALRLRGRVKLNQSLFADALADYEQAYQQNHETSSEAGLEYLQALKQIAEYFWERQDYQEALKQYRTIKHILDGSRDNGQPVQLWQDLWSEIVRSHYETGMQAYASVDVAEVPQAIAVLDREIETLEALGADDKAEAFRAKLKMLQIKICHDVGVAAFAEGNPEDISESIATLARQAQALQALNAGWESQDLHSKLKVLQIKAHYEAGIEAYATGDLEEIPRTIETLKQEIEALEALGAHREAQAFREKLKVLHIRVCYDRGLKAFAGGTPDDTAEAIVVLDGQIETLDTLQADQEIQELYAKRQVLQIKDHYNQGLSIFQESATEENLTDAIQRLNKVIESLDTLQADSESQDLQDKLRLLSVKAHYTSGLRAYRAEETSEDFASTIAILERELTALAALAAHSEIQDLSEKLRSLRARRQKAKKYDRIQELIAGKEYSEALASLDSEFIRAGDYEYRDVARLLWGLVSATKNSGHLPLEWDLSLPNHQKLAKSHTLNKYSIPLALTAAVILGGIIAPQIDGLPGLPIIVVIAFILLIVYFVFYTWIYYIDK